MAKYKIDTHESWKFGVYQKRRFLGIFSYWKIRFCSDYFERCLEYKEDIEKAKLPIYFDA